MLQLSLKESSLPVLLDQKLDQTLDIFKGTEIPAALGHHSTALPEVGGRLAVGGSLYEKPVPFRQSHKQKPANYPKHCGVHVGRATAFKKGSAAGIASTKRPSSVECENILQPEHPTTSTLGSFKVPGFWYLRSLCTPT